MSVQAAQTWLSLHKAYLPALDVLHRQALETLENPARTLGNLADVIALDPGMSISLFQQVDSKSQKRSQQPIQTVHSALTLLGDSAIADFVTQYKTLGETHPDKTLQQAYHQLMSRVYHLLAQLDQFVGIQGIRSIQEVRTAGLLHNVGEIYACLFDDENYRKYQSKFNLVSSDANSAKSVFGFDFHQLGREICTQMHLPELVHESLQEGRNTGRKARLIQLAADISHQAEVGWNHPAMKATLDVCADYLNQSTDGFEAQVQAIAIDAARRCPLDDVLAAAARLIMLPDLEKPASPVQTGSSNPADRGHDFENRIKDLLESSKANRSRLINLLLTHLEDDLQMSRVVLFLLSADRSKLGTRATRGIKEHSSINKLLIDTGTNKLFKSLLTKPLGLWISDDNYAKYKPLLPQRFKQCILSEHFFLMSLFVAGKPAGILFCDRAQAVSKLDRATYTRFKAAILLTGKALSYLAQRAKQKAT